MALPITRTSDYVGFYSISKNCYTELDLYIARYEPIYLADLMGCALKDLYVADLSLLNVPNTVRFLSIHNPFCDETLCTDEKTSEGIKEMLKGFIYFHYVRDSKYKQTATGTVVSQNEVSREAINNEQVMILNERYNNSIKTYKAIRAYLKKNFTTYPELKGSDKLYSFL